MMRGAAACEAMRFDMMRLGRTRCVLSCVTGAAVQWGCMLVWAEAAGCWHCHDLNILAHHRTCSASNASTVWQAQLYPVTVSFTAGLPGFLDSAQGILQRLAISVTRAELSWNLGWVTQAATA